MCSPPSPGRCGACGSPASGEEGPPARLRGPSGCRKLGRAARAPHPPAPGSPQNPAPPGGTTAAGVGVRGRLQATPQATPRPRPPRRGRGILVPRSGPGTATGLPGLRGSRGSHPRPCARARSRTEARAGARTPTHARARAHRPTRGRAHAHTCAWRSLGRPLVATSGSTRQPTRTLPPPRAAWEPWWVWVMDWGAGGALGLDSELDLPPSSCRPVPVCRNKAVLFPRTPLHHVTMGLQNYSISQRMCLGVGGAFHTSRAASMPEVAGVQRAGPSSLAVPVSLRVSSTSEAQTAEPPAPAC
ncbi:basic salivary proline-rich protein 3-like [Mustela lutreola]|uniref:basic salivary proline-rich protein 3-like n=1 Tax=Mustela lutreola TaxID=9666 RepID=UPI002796FF7F|nr:basic salivary proline-rich protein 3-like [Mustela lutreola]